jgi:hypothetical protein
MRNALAKTENDCMRCCVATILGANYNDVPDLWKSGDWRGELQAFVESYGSQLIWLAPELSWPVYHMVVADVEGGRHMVIFKGDELIYDPSPVKRKLLKIIQRYYIVPRDPARLHPLKKLFPAIEEGKTERSIPAKPYGDRTLGETVHPEVARAISEALGPAVAASEILSKTIDQAYRENLERMNKSRD